MTFNEGIQLDASNIETGGGAMGTGPKLALGGGVGGVIILVLGLLLGGGGGGDGQNPLGNIVNQIGGPGGQQDSADNPELRADLDACKQKGSGSANSDPLCLIAYTSNSVNDVWAAQFPQQTGHPYTPPQMKLFNDSVSTGCGAADSAVGPFYCPADKTAYFDPTFFQELVKLGGSNGLLSEEYVVAHEYGHHLSDLLGTLGASSKDPRGATSGGVRTELQADCFAGAWAYWATRVNAPGGNKPLIKAITENDVRQALQTAQHIGDDSLQEQAGQRVNPESFSHGSGQQRQGWFTRGYRTGQISSCDTFHARDLDHPGN